MERKGIFIPRGGTKGALRTSCKTQEEGGHFNCHMKGLPPAVGTRRGGGPLKKAGRGTFGMLH